MSPFESHEVPACMRFCTMVVMANSLRPSQVWGTYSKYLLPACTRAMLPHRHKWVFPATATVQVFIVLAASSPFSRQFSLLSLLIAHHDIFQLQSVAKPSHGSSARPPVQLDRSTFNRLLDNHHLCSGYHSFNAFCCDTTVHPEIHHSPGVVG